MKLHATICLANVLTPYFFCTCFVFFFYKLLTHTNLEKVQTLSKQFGGVNRTGHCQPKYLSSQLSRSAILRKAIVLCSLLTTLMRVSMYTKVLAVTSTTQNKDTCKKKNAGVYRGDRLVAISFVSFPEESPKRMANLCTISQKAHDRQQNLDIAGTSYLRCHAILFDGRCLLMTP